jgi:hypothetical protein
MLTAALADKGTESIIGEPQGGWFWLPAWSLWQPCAKKGQRDLRVLKKDGPKGYFRSYPPPPGRVPEETERSRWEGYGSSVATTGQAITFRVVPSSAPRWFSLRLKQRDEPLQQSGMSKATGRSTPHFAHPRQPEGS